MIHAEALWILLKARIAAGRASDEGLTTAEWVILIGIVATLALTVGAIITDKIINKANSTPGL